MPITRNASACPAPQVLTTGFLSLLNAYTQGSSFSLPCAQQIGGTALSPAFSANALALDLTATFGGGGVGVLYGLALSAGTGLSLNVSAGLACIGGLREIAASTVTVPNNVTAFIWMSQAGALSAVTGTTAPGTAYALLGACTTVSGAITAVDTSGVVFLKSGRLWRQTADNGMPTDSPNAALVGLLTQTAFNLYEWTGAAHIPVNIPQVTADPATPQPGDVWIRTDTSRQYVRVGGASKYVALT